MKEKIVYYPNHSHDPYYNQAFEEYLFQTRTDEEILLLWRNDAAVVCGNYQNIYAEVSIPDVLRHETAIVRRPSGGGTVYQDLGNLNYSWIRTCEQGKVDYDTYIVPLVEALNSIGIPAEKNRTSDIAVAGEKVSGSAQKLSGSRVLHHGTLLYETDLTALRQLANGQRDDYCSKGTKSVPWPVTNMVEHMEKALSMTGFITALEDVLCSMYDVTEKFLTKEEECKVRQMETEKYLSWEWTFGKSPRFSCRRAILRPEDRTELVFEARHGVIEQVEIHSAVFPELSQMTELWIGKRLDISELQALCKELPEVIPDRMQFWRNFF